MLLLHTEKRVYPARPRGQIAGNLELMRRSYLNLLIFLCAAGCATKAPGPLPAPAASEPLPVPVAIDPSPAMPEPDPVPGACERLLESLAETQPLLAGLDASLAANAERFEAAVADLQKPPPPAPSRACPPSSSNALGGKEIIGAVEWLYMDPPGRHFRARVDSGAETSSLSATEITEFERDGEDWVRFSILDDDTDESVDLELPIKRTALVRQASGDELIRRFVIELEVRLGSQLQTTEFMLSNRSNWSHPILLGRAFLMDLYVVDVSRTYTRDRNEAP